MKWFTWLTMIFSVLSSCKDDPEDYCQQTDQHYTETTNWLTELKAKGSIKAMSSDSLLETFNLYCSDYYRNDYGCPHVVNFERYISYTGTVTDERLLVEASDVGPYQVLWFGISNKKGGSYWNISTEAPDTLFKYSWPYPGHVVHLSDTVVNGKTYYDVYRITPPQTSWDAIQLKFALISKSKGFIICQTQGGFTWYFQD